MTRGQQSLVIAATGVAIAAAPAVFGLIGVVAGAQWQVATVYAIARYWRNP